MATTKRPQSKPTPEQYAQAAIIASLPPDPVVAAILAEGNRHTFLPDRAVTTYPSESSKWKHLAASYLKGNGIELATGGDPIVPTSIQFELSEESYNRYNSSQPARGLLQWRSDTAIFDLPFKDQTLDYVASSHLLEDFLPEQQFQLLKEWVRVLKIGGKLLVCVPDNTRWDKAVANGQCPNCSHRHCFHVGELSSLAPKLGLSIVCDKLTEIPIGDYNIMFCATRRS